GASDPVGADPDLVPVGAQLDPLLHERGGRAVEAAAVTQVAVGRHPHQPAGRPVETLRRQRPQCPPLLFEPLLDQKTATRVATPVADLVAPVGVLAVELAQRAEAARRPEARLQVAHRRLDRPLLPRRRWRTRGRVEGVVAAQVQEALIPDNLVALASGYDRALIVVAV